MSTLIDFSTLSNQASAKQAAILIIQTINATADDDKRKVTTGIIDSMYDFTISKQATPMSKWLLLRMLQEITLMKQAKYFLGNLAATPLFKHYYALVQETDPKRPIRDKGRFLYTNDQSLGIKYMRLMTEIIVMLGEKFKRSPDGQSTRYNKLLNGLIENGVTLPDQFHYYPNLRRASESSPQPQTNSSKALIPNRDPMPSALQKDNASSRVLNSQVDYTVSKLSRLANTLSMDLPPEELEQSIKDCHNGLQKDLAKNQKAMETINQQQLLNVLFKLNQFTMRQNRLYKQMFSVGNIPAYIDNYKSLHQEVFGADHGPIPASNLSQANPRQSANIQMADGMVADVFKKLEAKHALSNGGFQAIRDALRKQTQSSKKTRQRAVKQRSLSPYRGGASSQVGTSTSPHKSAFLVAPNMNPPARSFEGKVISPNNDEASLMALARKPFQGLRRFKIANFKNKSTLYENQHVQVGQKSETVFEEVAGFRAVIGLQLFVGNKTDQQIKNLRLSYKSLRHSQSMDQWVWVDTQMKKEL